MSSKDVRKMKVQFSSKERNKTRVYIELIMMGEKEIL